MPPRYFIRFEKADGSDSRTWKSNRYEYEQSQGLVASKVNLVGEDYLFDQRGTQRGLKTNATERVRFLDLGDADDIDVDIDRFKEIVDWGVGKIVTKGANGTERWAWGRPVDMPSLSFNVEQVYHQPVIMNFERHSDFYGVSVVHTEVLGSSPDTILVTNPGNADAYDAIITLKGTFTNPVIQNDSAFLEGTSTPYKLESTRDGVDATDWLKFDARRNEVMFSTDTGAIFTDDSANFVIQDGQLRQMVLVPGVNSIVITGANGATVVVEFTESWH